MELVKMILDQALLTFFQVEEARLFLIKTAHFPILIWLHIFLKLYFHIWIPNTINDHKYVLEIICQYFLLLITLEKCVNIINKFTVI